LLNADPDDQFEVICHAGGRLSCHISIMRWWQSWQPIRCTPP
jgi:hypothetical protein